jgi:hypothetical protein
MKHSLLLVPVLATALVTGCCHRDSASRAGEGRSAAVAGPSAAARPDKVVPGEYILTVASGTTLEMVQATFADLAPKRLQDLGGNMILAVFGEDPGLQRLQLRVGDGRILAVQPNYVYRVQPR